MKPILLAFVGLLIATSAAAVEPSRMQVPRGATIELIAEFPTGAGPFPAVVLAPGQGYHMQLPALEATAKSLTAQGVAVFRFNWAYFSAVPKGAPSDDLALEVEDMSAVIAAAKSDPRVRQSDVWVAGKSLGSLVAWRVLGSDKSLRGGVFLTPVCSRATDASSAPVSVADANYPGLKSESRPLVFVLGDKDPLCSPSVLYRFLADAPATTRVGVVSGDHGFENKARAGAAANAALEMNLRLVAEFITLAISDVSLP